MIVPNDLSGIASMIRRDWQKMDNAAKPYVSAMSLLTKVSDSYGHDSGEIIVRYFLNNASTWRGETAKAVKAKLNELLKSN